MKSCCQSNTLVHTLNPRFSRFLSLFLAFHHHRFHRLGKTVQLLALIQSDKDHRNDEEDEEDDTSSENTNLSTLVVAPLSLLHQWQQEIETKTTLSHRVHYVGEGTKKQTTSGRFVTNETVDVVVTTYGTLQAEFRSHKRTNGTAPTPTPLLSQHWRRVILDECHTIKNHSTMVARACCNLRAERRWAVSGTIVQNSLEDVYSLLRFLKHEPFSEHAFWKTSITKAPDFGLALDRVRRLLGPITLRRTKETRDEHGRKILVLPTIDSESVAVDFSPEERQFYEALYRKSFAIFEGFFAAGNASSSWLKIFSLLHRLRQTCSHVALTVRSHLDDTEWTSHLQQSQSQSQSNTDGDGDGDDNYGDDSEHEHDDAYAQSIATMLNKAVQSDSSELNEECPICLDNISMNDSAITPCLHIFCQDCLLEVLGTKPKARASDPSRSQSRTATGDARNAQAQALHEEDGHARTTLRTAVQGTSSSKLQAILEELRKVWEKEPGSKVLIFSQFLGFLDIMEKAFRAESIPYARLDGKLSLRDRMRVLREFGSDSSPQRCAASSRDSNNNNNNTGSVLLISMKAGGVVRCVALGRRSNVHVCVQLVSRLFLTILVICFVCITFKNQGLNLVAARSVFIVGTFLIVIYSITR
eukprot:jgi/Psemu1/180943/e_gw1.18.208.1